MKLDLGSNVKREDILRGVYEDNLRIVNKHMRPASVRPAPVQPAPVRPAEAPRRPRRSPWGLRAGLLLTGVLLVMTGFQIWQEIQAQQFDAAGAAAVVAVPDPGTPLSAAERMAREFNSPTDPGLDVDGRTGAAVEVPIAKMFNLQVKTIVVDPGHGGEDPGAVGPTGTREKDVTLDVARRLQRRLQRSGFQVLMTRDDDRKVSLRDRVAFANEHGADLFISIHVNSLPAEEVTSVETYYFGLQADEKTLHVAELENTDSDLTMADFRHALEKIGNTMKFQESKQLATSIQKTLYRNMRRVNSAVSDWGARRGPFVVLLGVEVPSVLTEIAVLSNRAEEAKLNTPEHREALAMALEAGIVGYLHPRPEMSEPTEQATAYGSEKDE